MIALYLVQAALAVAVIAVVVERARLLLYRAPLDRQPYLAALRGALADGDRGAARALVDAGRPAWIARVAGVVLSPDPDAGSWVVEETLSDLKYEAFKGLRALRILASMATASGFLGAVVQVLWMVEGRHGLEALQAGRVESIAVEKAVTAMVAGIAISATALTALQVLKKAAVGLVRDANRTVSVLEETLDRTRRDEDGG